MRLSLFLLFLLVPPSLSTPILHSLARRVHSSGRSLPDFGHRAEKELRRARDERDGIAAATARPAQGVAAESDMIRELWSEQVAAETLRAEERWTGSLRRAFKVDPADGSIVPPKEAEMDRAMADALRDFEERVAKLSVPSLSLLPSGPVASLSRSLSSLLDSYPDSPAAKVRSLSAVRRSASKPKPPSDRGVKLSGHLVAMFRPPGFGSLSSYGMYSDPTAGHSVTVGVCNDGDSPEVINAFGGMRPPWLRLQPKVKIDVDL